MRSRARQEKRLQEAQDTVGTRRAEREEQGSLAAQSNLQRMAPARAAQNKPVKRDEPDPSHLPRHVARPGKPLKRQS